jgi:glycosyltransferase involved in cell wall biosynthesis
MVQNTEEGGDYLFLSYLITDEEFQRVTELDASPQIATHKFNWKILKGIYHSKFFKDKLHIISTRSITDYPRSKIKYVKNKNWKTDYGIFHEIGYINYPVIKLLNMVFTSMFQCIYWAIKTPNKKKKGIIVYSISLPYLVSGYLVSKIFNLPLIGIWTDPPGVPTPWDTKSKQRLRDAQDKIVTYFMKKFTGVISLTDDFVKDFNPQAKKLIIEAISDTKPDIEDNINDLDISIPGDKFILLYSGSLLKIYGIFELVKAFSMLDYPDMELWIFGKGDIENEINDLSKNNLRIKFFGFMDNNKVIEYQKRASLLINPRPTNLVNAKYSFPSKILEYMESGTPTVVTKLPGIPKEYDDYLFFFDDSESEAFKRRIEEIYLMNRLELKEVGLRAKDFSRTKSIAIQGDKIVNFINDITNKYKN